MASELVEILNDCEDNKSSLDKVLDSPLARQIHAGTYDPATAANYEELYEALKKTSYLSVDATAIFTELVDRIGMDSKAFNATYTKTELPTNLRKLYLGIADDNEEYVNESAFLQAYTPSPEANYFFVQELLLRYGKPPYTAAKLRQLPVPATIAAATDIDLLQKVLSAPPTEHNLRIAAAAVRADRLDCLKLMWDKLESKKEMSWLVLCLEYDSIECFKFLSEQKGVDEIIDIEDTYEHDSSQIFDYLVDKRQLTPLMQDALGGYAIKCIKSIIQRGYDLTEDDLLEASNNIRNRPDAFKFLVQAKKFTLQDQKILGNIISADNIEILELVLHEYKEVSEAALRKIRTSSMLEYLCKAGYIPALETIYFISRRLDIFESALTYYVKAKGVSEIDTSLCELIAACHPVRVLRLAHELGCPWDQGTLIAAITEDDVETFRYAIENGCPHDLEQLKHNAEGTLIGQYLHLVYPKLFGSQA